MGSLLDDSMRSVGSPKAAAGGKNQGMKLAVAVGLLVVAGVIVAWSQGLFNGKEPPPPPPTAEEQKAYQDAQKRTEQLKQQNKVVIEGAS
jgi:hypothetical protein